MATLNYNVQVDMSTPQFWYGDVYLANATNIIIDAGSYRGIYSGSFRYSKTGAVSGKLNSYEQFDNIQKNDQENYKNYIGHDINLYNKLAALNNTKKMTFEAVQDLIKQGGNYIYIN